MKFPRRKAIVASALIGVALLLAGAAAVASLVRAALPAGPQPAPEAQVVQVAQSSLPFQVLIPAFLPARFSRDQVAVRSDLQGPNAEPMFELIYADSSGGQLVLHEWLPKRDASGAEVSFRAASAGQGESAVSGCGCGCPMCASLNSTSAATGANPFQVDRDRLRILAGVTSAELLTYIELQTILSTLAPAAGLTVYSTIEDVPLSDTVPPAVPAEINAQGVQEVALVITAKGYDPQHFSVKQGVPVRITFRQLGDVGCGNELEVEWGQGQSSKAILENANDVEVIDITPEAAGDFSYHCSHLIYRGVMTVNE